MAKKTEKKTPETPETPVTPAAETEPIEPDQTDAGAENPEIDAVDRNESTPETDGKTDDAPDDKSVQTKPVKLTIKREHVIRPHSIELRKENGFVIDARTEDHEFTETIGAKTVEQILREAGAELPATDDAELVITFSPHNGEVIAVAVA